MCAECVCIVRVALLQECNLVSGMAAHQQGSTEGDQDGGGVLLQQADGLHAAQHDPHLTSCAGAHEGVGVGVRACEHAAMGADATMQL